MPARQTLLLTSLILAFSAAQAETAAETAEYGDYIDWRVLGVSHRLEKKYVRAIVGNNTAIHAGREGKTLPWPDGSIIAKLSWKEKVHPRWPAAIVPGEFAGAEAMVKDAKKYAATGGWGFGHWEGKTLVMNDENATATCFACHTTMKDNDYVFTEPAFKK
ncbi:MAG: cytochrome P460 family protein [Methylococcales bacterium]|nr:cytochrome P460 family protein [Methylococcales bacterium]